MRESLFAFRFRRAIRSYYVVIIGFIIALIFNSLRLFPEKPPSHILVVQIDSRDVELDKVPYDHNEEHCPLFTEQRFNYTSVQKSIAQVYHWCSTFDYDYIYVKTHATNRAQWKFVWDRTWVLPKVMRNYPNHRWILYLDADLFPKSPLIDILDDIRAQATLERDFYMTAWDETGAELNAGIILFRNNEAMKSIFHLWATAIENKICPEALRRGGYCEQECMKDHMMKKQADQILPHFQHVKYHTRVFFHCFGGWMKMVHCGARCAYDINLNKLNITSEIIDETLLKVKEKHVVYMDKDINESPKGY